MVPPFVMKVPGLAAAFAPGPACCASDCKHLKNWIRSCKKAPGLGMPGGILPARPAQTIAPLGWADALGGQRIANAAQSEIEKTLRIAFISSSLAPPGAECCCRLIIRITSPSPIAPAGIAEVSLSPGLEHVINDLSKCETGASNEPFLMTKRQTRLTPDERRARPDACRGLANVALWEEGASMSIPTPRRELARVTAALEEGSEEEFASAHHL